MKQAKRDAKTKNAYKPSSTLTKYLEEKLQLLKLEKESKMRGKPLSDENQKKKELNQRKRVHVLNHHIFESMANLVYFFEFIRDNPQLQDEFEDETEELLMGWNKNDKWKIPAFARLVYGVTSWEYDKDPSNFRLSLLPMIQRAITAKIPYFFAKDFDKDAGSFGISKNIVGPDMNRALAWALLYSRKPETQKESEYYHRPVLF